MNEAVEYLKGCIKNKTAKKETAKDESPFCIMSNLVDQKKKVEGDDLLFPSSKKSLSTK